MQSLDGYRRGRRPVERALAGEDLVQHHAQRVEIGCERGVFAENLLWAHVLGRSRRRPGHRDPAATSSSGDPEVCDLNAAGRVDQDAPRREAAVNDPVLMSGLERASHAGGDPERGIGRQPAQAGDPAVEVLALCQPHDDEFGAIVGARVVHRHDVRVVERRGIACLSSEGRDDLGIRAELRSQTFTATVRLRISSWAR
jgi:hypothetical protein